MSQTIDQEFSGWRKLLWPIHSFEVKKFLPMGIMMLCILFIYTVLRDTKDTMIGVSDWGQACNDWGQACDWGQ